MFHEVKPFQMIKLEEVSAYCIYPNGDSESNICRTLYIRLSGVKESLYFTFDTMRECRIAYNRLRKALDKLNGEKVDAYVYDYEDYE